jgi:hypothetical protein
MRFHRSRVIAKPRSADARDAGLATTYNSRRFKTCRRATGPCHHQGAVLGAMMRDRQRDANRENARALTGPRTPEGKAAIRLNAVQHGLLCRDVVLPGEDAEASEHLCNRVWTDLAPAGLVEELLTDRVINAMWRLRRLEQEECALFPWRIHHHESRRRGVKAGR